MFKAILPRKLVCPGPRERRQMLLLALASIYDGLVTILSLGFYTTDIRAWLLFEVFENDVD